jgi:hypothetical protein
MTAGVRDTWVSRCVRTPGRLAYRQSIEVGTESNMCSAGPCPDHDPDTRRCWAKGLQTKPPQQTLDESGRAPFGMAQLRPAVNRTPNAAKEGELCHLIRVTRLHW